MPTSGKLTRLLTKPLGLFGVVLLTGGCTAVLGWDDVAPRRQSVADASTDSIVAETSTDAGDLGVTDADTGPPTARPPGRPPGDPVASGKGRDLWLVVKRYYLTTQDRDGRTISGAWKKWGYNVDNICTGDRESEENTGTCTRPTGARRSSLVDGEECRDNNFGSQVIPLLTVLDPTFEDTSNAVISKGAATWLLKLEDLDDGPNDPLVRGKLYWSSLWKDYGVTKPKFDGTDERDIDGDAVTDGNINAPRAIFERGYLKDNVWVSGEGSTFPMNVPLVGRTVIIPLVGGQITLDVMADHKSAGLGVVAGALLNDAFLEVLPTIGDAAGICAGNPLYESAKELIPQAADLYFATDGKLIPKTTAICNSVSLGMGFATAPVVTPTRVVPARPPAKTCP